VPRFAQLGAETGSREFLTVGLCDRRSRKELNEDTGRSANRWLIDRRAV